MFKKAIDVKNLPAYEMYSDSSYPTKTIENPYLRTLAQVAFGNNIAPFRRDGEDMRDAMLRRDRSIDLAKLKGKSLLTNPIVEAAGISEKLSPLTGGNMNKAINNLHENLAGTNTMGAFKQQSANNVEDTMEALKSNIYKKAFQVIEASTPTAHGFKFLSDTMGRVGGLPTALMVGQEKTLDMLGNPTRKDFNSQLSHLQADRRLKNTVLRLSHTDPVNDIQRLWKNKDLNPALKALGTLTAPVNALQASLTRASHYNPATDTAVVYGKIPEIAHHELGHARDFNNSQLGGLGRAAGMFAENKMMPAVAGPVTQFLETQANIEAEKGYQGDKKEFRRRLWPARATYWGNSLFGAAMMHPGLRDKALEYMTGSPGEEGFAKYREVGNHPIDTLLGEDDDARGMLLRTALLMTAPTAISALGGRLFAETRNLFGDKKTKKAALVEAIKHKIAKDLLEGGKADNMPDSRYPKKELLKGLAHEKEHVKNPQIAKEIAKDHLEETGSYYTKLEKAKID
jgi:hypothetical protein